MLHALHRGFSAPLARYPYSVAMGSVNVCPGCGHAVTDDEKYLVAQEYEKPPGSTQRDFDLQTLAKGPKRRFHIGHFHKRIGNHVYEFERDGPN